MLNYQYIQCLNLSDEDIDKLLQKDITEIKEVIGDNYIKSILYGRGKDLNDRNVWIDDVETRHINTLMINKDCINDSSNTQYKIHCFLITLLALSRTYFLIVLLVHQ